MATHLRVLASGRYEVAFAPLGSDEWLATRSDLEPETQPQSALNGGC